MPRSSALSLRAPQLVPADVRRLHVCRQRAHLFRKKAEARVSRRFFARREHRLQSQADSKNRHARVERRAQRLGQISLTQARDECGEVSDSGKHDRFRRGQLRRLDRALGFRAQSAQRAFDRRQIPGAVVDDGDFHSSPFVDGSTRRSCLSRVTAKRSAFANALKIDST